MTETQSQEPGPRVRKLSRRAQFLILGAALLAIVLVIAAVWLFEHFLRPAPPPAPAAEAPGVFRPTKEQWASLQTAPMQTMTFRSELTTDGNIAFNDDATTPVFSPYSGRVTRLIAKLGDTVAKGAPLMAIEASEFVQGQNDLVAAFSALKTARAQAAQAEATEKRQHELYLAKAGALKDWLQSQTDLASARNNLRSAETAAEAARGRLRILDPSQEIIRKLEDAPTGERLGTEALVRAPIAGTVTQRQVGLGQFITSATGGAANPVYSIGNLATVWLIANVREADAHFIRLGQPVEVRVLAYPGRVFKARIAWIAPAVDANTHRLPVRAEVENRDGSLKPMMFASFSIIAGETTSALAIPERAVVYEGEEARVFVARDDGTIALRLIRPGRTREGMLEVLSGLSAGERVVTGGALFVDRATRQ
ncbi:MAG TPA: efflux RND transporter periplasmic adaptor subunit [Usitatibacter sp.]|nr:efflux RND transporter periplasmic adaptor subunit [Usitatibacter sp.]